LRSKKIIRDISWLSFNNRVLQEAKDSSVHLYNRLRFLGIFSNNLDEFFRVRVGTLNKMLKIDNNEKIHIEEHPEKILKQIQELVLNQQITFDETFAEIIKQLELNHNIYFKNEKQLNKIQKTFVQAYFEDKVRTQIVPLMIESMPQAPFLRDRSIYLACVLGNTQNPMLQRYALIQIPEKEIPRFVIIPAAKKGEINLILLEDIIRYNLKFLFAPFGFNRFSSHIVKLTRDAELELDNDLNNNVIADLEKGLKNRNKGKATRFVYDRQIDLQLLDYLTKRLNLLKKDNLIAGSRIHNFKDFMDFPKSVFKDIIERPKSFVHPSLVQPCRIMEIIEKKDIMLHFPYHSFDSVIDLLREAAIDPFVQSIKITVYRLARQSKVINALLNAVRNGKSVTVVIELRARFDEEANLHWKSVLEEEGIKVFLGVPDMKVHAKICVIKKREFNKTIHYGFISTGNFNESTAQVYGDHLLLTTNKAIMSDVNRIFDCLDKQNPRIELLKNCKTLVTSPQNMRKFFLNLIIKEIKFSKKKHDAKIQLKLNSLVDEALITQLYLAAKAGVNIELVIRGICCALTEQKAFKKPIKAISVIDEYLEHARIFIFNNNNEPIVYISSADWMVRNLDHRVEVACPINDPSIKEELMTIFSLQSQENVKGRILDNEQLNLYVEKAEDTPVMRSQIEIYHYLRSKIYRD
jgi:polyphosphate kinase